jgi:SAM-dependent methyltransferase/methyltransferase-like protein
MTTSYDELPYPSFPYPQTQPENLAVLARCFGLEAPPPRTARLLELGCASGGNLLPLAERYPDAEFLGIDLSGRQIAEGQAVAAALGLKNLTLRQASILDLAADAGLFDYIVCHGVFSWVPPDVRNAILSVCKRNLKPDGVAYVSYNTYPGWHMRGMLREIMCFHAARFNRPEDQVRQARLLLDFLAASVGSDRDPYAVLLTRESDLLRRLSDAYLYHEHLEEHNEPCYFFEFVQQANQAGLQYLGDAVLATMMLHGLKPDAAQTLQRLAGTLIEMEQYLDFLRSRTFRSTLLCHADVPLTRNLKPEVLHGLHAASSAKAVPLSAEASAMRPGQPGTTEYRTETGAFMTTTVPLVRAVLDVLGEAWPESLPVAEVAARAALRAPLPAGADAVAEVEGLLLGLWTGAMAEVSLAPARCVRQPGERPLAAPLARWQAEHGDWATTLRHNVCKLDELSRFLLPLLDGSRDRAVLLAELAKLTAAGKLTVRLGNRPLTEASEVRTALTESLPVGLDVLARNGLLLA